MGDDKKVDPARIEAVAALSNVPTERGRNIAIPSSSATEEELNSVLTVLEHPPLQPVVPARPTFASLAMTLASPLALFGKSIEGIVTAVTGTSVGAVSLTVNIILLLIAGIAGALLAHAHFLAVRETDKAEKAAKNATVDPHVARAIEIVRRRLDDTRRNVPLS
jgi:hypothetical protein